MAEPIEATPVLTVVVPSVNGLHDLVPCCDALNEVRARIALEVLVVDRLGGDVAATVRSRFPWVTLHEVPRATTIPQMRDAAFRLARAEAIAVIEDHVIVPPEWGERLLAALAEGHDVVGGPIENAASERLLDWATFLCEYSACLPPLPEGEAAWLPGNNVVYRRAVLQRYLPITAQGAWENRLHDAMRADGVRLVCRANLLVGHKKHFGLLEYAGQRFLYSRSYAGARVQGATFARRLATGAAAFALPPLLLLRITRSLVAKGVPMGRVMATLPFISAFVVAWGLGEVVGYWLGAGNALSRVR
ncbi:MAG: glycosyltransferase [Gemmatimonadaceae bacterium]|nr:glycosyltransferase [Gemmatimonadaceae bacterium]